MINREFVSMTEYADAIGVSYTTVKNWIKKEQISYKRFPSGTIRIPRSELEV